MSPPPVECEISSSGEADPKLPPEMPEAILKALNRVIVRATTPGRTRPFNVLIIVVPTTGGPHEGDRIGSFEDSFRETDDPCSLGLNYRRLCHPAACKSSSWQMMAFHPTVLF
jgi:hypothetical protein